MSTEEIKEKIAKDIDKLPDNSLQEVLDFISFKISKAAEEEKKEREKVKNLDPAKDPLLKNIGSFEVEPFANKIDDELYGEKK